MVEKKNMIVLLCDCLRYDHVNIETTPNIMKIAEEGTFYTNVSSVGTNTLTSMPFLLSASKEYSSEKSIPTILARNDYYTSLVSTNWLVYNLCSRDWHHSSYYPKFDRTGVLTTKVKALRSFLGESIHRHLPKSLKDVIIGLWVALHPFELPYIRAEDMLDITLKNTQKIPYFIWTHLMDPHLPYYPQKRREGESVADIQEIGKKLLDMVFYGISLTKKDVLFLKSLYRRSVVEMDVAIGEFYSKLPDNTILVITSDHGEELGEHGGFSHTQDKFIPELCHVPLIISGSNGAMVLDEPMTHLRFKDLICELLDVA